VSQLSSESLLNEGLSHHQAGRLEEAAACYRRILESQPSDADALHYLGLTFLQTGDFPAAIASILSAISIRADVPEYHVNLGNAFKRAQREEEAEAAYREALRLRPDFPAVWFNLALLLKESGKREEAIGCLEIAARNPAAPAQVWIELGDSFHGTDDRRAIDCYSKAYPLASRDPALLARLGGALLKLGRAEPAAKLLEEVCRLGGENGQVLNALGSALAALGRLSESERVLRRALVLDPDNPEVIHSLADTLKESGFNREAIDLFRRALELSPDKRAIGTQYLFSLLYSDQLDASEVLAEHRRCCSLYLPPAEPLARHTSRKGPLRVGYLSADMHRNAVAFFLLGILEAHDRSRFDVHVYSTGPVADEWTTRLRAAVPHWRSLHGKTAEAIAECIRADQVDVLVDLGGHLSDNIAVLARRAAPVQINYLGYAFSTGLPAMDYRITDWTTDPAGSEGFASEQLLRLERGYYAYTTPDDAPAVKPLPATKRRHLTFGACCHFAKITPRTLDLWGRLLSAVPSARLRVRTRAFSDSAVRARFLKALAKRGVRENRVLAEPYVPNEGRWLFYHEIDVGLDTFPFNLATNTCEALWMGVPTLTFGESSHQARMGVTIMRAAGLSDFAANDEDDWLLRAQELAGQIERLNELRATMRNRLAQSELCDSTGAARALESVYEQVASRQWP
jgi:protein O-GlcNAc transferase